jgi:hypothetical protein
MPLTLKQGDTFPEIEFLLEASPDGGGDPEPVDLSGADSIEIVAKCTSPTTLIIGTCAADADQVTNKGQGTYTLAADDSSVPGDYDVEWKVTWDAAATPPTVERFPNEGYESMTIGPNLGG